MSRIAKQPVDLPAGVKVEVDGQRVTLTGPNGSLALDIHPTVKLVQEEQQLKMTTKEDSALAMAGTMRALLRNMVIGVTKGFQKKLQLVGVGYRAQVQGNKLNLTLGFSHPVEHAVPEGVKVETPSQTEIVVSGADKQQVGQIASEIRAYRPPEPYKGKGVRYADERIVRKETKKA